MNTHEDTTVAHEILDRVHIARGTASKPLSLAERLLDLVQQHLALGQQVVKSARELSELILPAMRDGLPIATSDADWPNYRYRLPD